MGFADVRDLVTESRRIGNAIRQGTPVTASDLRRALVATEIVFRSDVFGAGVEWETVTGLKDQETMPLLRHAAAKARRGRQHLAGSAAVGWASVQECSPEIAF